MTTRNFMATILVTGGADSSAPVMSLPNVRPGIRLSTWTSLPIPAIPKTWPHCPAILGIFSCMATSAMQSLWSISSRPIGPTLWSTLPPKAMWNVRFLIQKPSCAPTSSESGTLLRTAKAWWSELDASKKAAFRFLHVSTDEVFGALQPGDPAFTETTPYTLSSSSISVEEERYSKIL